MPPLRRTRICVAVAAVVGAGAPVHAQITTDGTLGAVQAFSGFGTTIPASLGRQAGANLFHSFGTFNVPTGGSAIFAGPVGGPAVSNVISRVTGAQASSINGRLGLATEIHGANLFLINPSGILFGANASLDLTGSFFASTANYLKLADGTRFEATATANPILTAAPPAAFGFLGPTGPITVQGSQLQVAEGKSLNLVGGPVTVSDASLRGVAGDLRLVGLGGTGEVSLAGDATAGTPLAPVLVERSAFATASANGAPPGSILIRGGQLTLLGASLESTNSGQADAPPVVLAASGDLTVSASNITSQTGGSGRGADLLLSGDNVTVDHNSQVGSITWGDGRGGDAMLAAGHAARVVAAAEDPGYTNVYSWAFGSGDGGNLAVAGDTVTVQSGNVYSFTERGGAGGSISLRGREVSVTSGAWVYAYNWWGTPGPTGAIDIAADQRAFVGGLDWFGNQAFVFTQTLGGGRAGDVRLAAPSIDVIGGLVRSFTFGAGDAGSLRLDGDVVRLRGGNGGLAMVDTTAVGGSSGNGGDIDVRATRSVEISRGDYWDWTRLATSTFSVGRGGDVTVEAPNITVRDDASIWVGAFGGGAGGAIRLRGEDVSVVAAGKIESVAAGNGRGGDIDIAASRRFYASHEIPVPYEQHWDKGIFSRSFGSGDAGDIRISAPEVTFLGSFIHSGAHGGGNAGTLRFEGDVVRFLGGNNNIAFVESGASNLSTGGGGNVEVRARTRFELSGAGFPQDWTRMAATTQGSGRGGEIVIESPSILIETATVFSRTRFGTGEQGGITLRGNEIRLQNHGQIASATDGDRKGSFVLIEAGSLTVEDASQIFANTGGSGDAGQVTINAQRVRLTGASSIEAASGVGTGNAGDIVLNIGESLHITGRHPAETGFLFLPRSVSWPGGLLTQASGSGNAGRVIIRAPSIVLDDGRIFSTALGSGDGGRVEIRAGDLVMRNGAQIDARSAEGSSGNAGAIDVAVTGRLEITGFSPIDGERSGLYAQTRGSGQGGNITLGAAEVHVADGGRIEARSSGTGTAGSINIAASDALRIFGGKISSEALQADGGNIDIRVGNLVHLKNSEITTAVGSGAGAGGNIFIDPTFVILENSRITANAFGGPGGNIRIIATYFLNTLDSLVDASSTAGVPGTVQISSPNTNLSTQIKVLPATFFDATQLVREACAGRGVAAGNGGSSLVGVGRGGLAASPERFATSTYFSDAPAAASAPSATGLKLVTAKQARLGGACSS